MQTNVVKSKSMGTVMLMAEANIFMFKNEEHKHIVVMRSAPQYIGVPARRCRTLPAADIIADIAANIPTTVNHL